MIEKGIISLLLGNTVLTDPNRQTAQASLLAKLGSNAIFPEGIPEGTAWPVGVVHRTGGDHVKTLGGLAGFGTFRVAVDFYCTTYSDARLLVHYALGVLGGYRGRAGPYGNPPVGFFVQGMFPSDNPDEYVPPAHAEEFGIEAAGMEFDVWANEMTS